MRQIYKGNRTSNLNSGLLNFEILISLSILGINIANLMANQKNVQNIRVIAEELHRLNRCDLPHKIENLAQVIENKEVK